MRRSGGSILVRWVVILALGCNSGSSSEDSSSTPTSNAITIEERCEADPTCAVAFYEPLSAAADEGNDIPEPYDPADTVDDFTITWNRQGFVVDVVPMRGRVDSPPVALAGRSHVLHALGNSRLEAFGDVEGVGSRRMCHVNYYLIEGDWRAGDACPSGSQRFKMHTYQWNEQVDADQWTIENWPDGFGCGMQSFGVNHSLEADMGIRFSYFSTDLAESTWLRLESCIATSQSDFTQPGGVSAEYRVTRLDTGEQDVVSYGDCCGDRLADTNGGLWLAGINFDSNDGIGHLWWSTVAQLVYDEDLGQWPGPDCDLEPNAVECP